MPKRKLSNMKFVIKEIETGKVVGELEGFGKVLATILYDGKLHELTCLNPRCSGAADLRGQKALCAMSDYGK